MKKHCGMCLIAVLLMIITPKVATSALMDLPDVDGKGYFKDLTTGYVWMDVDNFVNMTYAEVISSIPTSFHLASGAEMTALSSSVGPIANYTTTFNQLYNIVGGWESPAGGDNYVAKMIYGRYGEGGSINGDDYHYPWVTDVILSQNGAIVQSGHWWQQETYVLDSHPMNGAWVVSLTYIPPDGSGTNPVPEPSTLFLLGAGLICLVSFNKRKLMKN